MLRLAFLAAAALRLPDEFPPLEPAAEEKPAPDWGVLAGGCSVWFEISGGHVRKSTISADKVSLRGDLGMKCFAMPLPVRVVYKRKKTAYEIGFWYLTDSGSARADENFTFDGVAVIAGEKVNSELYLGFCKVAYRKVMWDTETLRLFVDAAADFIDLDVSVRAPAGKGSFDELIPIVTVGLEAEVRLAPEIYFALRTTGLSWSELLGVQGDLFSVEGTYRHLEVGVLWRPALRTYVGASYRFLEIGFGSDDRAVDMTFQGLSFSARYWW